MEQASTGKIILKTAIITTLALALACVLVAVFVFFCFPYQGYKFTNDLGMKKSALFFAEKYADDDNLDGFVYCVELDKQLIAKTNDLVYDQKMLSHTERFFAVGSLGEEFFKTVDEYYIANSPRQAHVGLYSYEEYLVTNNYVSRVRLNEASEMIFRGKPTKLDEIAATEDITNSELAIVYSAISAALSQRGENGFEIMISDDEPTDFCNWIESTVPKFIGELADFREDTLKELFFMNKAIGLINGMIDLLDDSDKSSDEWNAYFSITGDIPLTKEYARLYMQYINQ